MSYTKRGNGRGPRTSGWRPIPRLLLVGWILVTTSGCATVPKAPPFLPVIPERPTLQMRPQSAEVQGHSVRVLLEADWLQLGGYVLELERQLIAACLALGGSAAQCRALEHQ